MHKVTDTEGGKIPSWLHAAGGLGTVNPGKSGTVTQVLEPGNYYVGGRRSREERRPRQALGDG